MIEAALHAEIEDCLSAGRRIAIWFSARVGMAAQFDEFQSAAVEALCEAADSYDPSRRIPLIAYAKRRMFGAVRDHYHWMMNRKRAGVESVVEYAEPPDRTMEFREFDRIDRIDEAEDFIRTLPIALRPLARYLLIDGLSQAESARALDMSPGYVSRLRRQIDERASRFAA